MIIIGKTGSGKLALANVLSNSDEFKEENSSLTKEFESEKIKYRVIDTVGLGDIKLTKEKLLEKFEEEIGTYIDEGISQIFWVIEGKFSESERALDEFLWLNEYLFDNKVLDYTTIIRTNFPNFRNKENREKDTKELINFFNDSSKEGYAEINEKVLKKEKIVHVDNPPFNENLRKKSNKKLLDYLKKFSNKEPYRSNLRTKDNNGQTELTRGTAVTGGILAATNPILGGVLAAVSPVVEINNFNELLGTLKRIAGGELGEVNKKLDELNNKVKEFLQDYDKDGNREIDLDELINERMKFNKELDKIEAIERAIKALEKEVIKYKKGSIGEEKDEETESTKSETQLTPLEAKLAQRKKEREQLEQKKNELAVELKEIEIHCQQIKKELSQCQNDLLLLTDTDEEKGLLKEKIIDLKKELREVEQKRHDISQQLIKTNVVLFSQQIKNLNLGSK
ncbi:10337_t:CDS:2, partial [Cetraspora pellucida]